LLTGRHPHRFPDNAAALAAARASIAAFTATLPHVGSPALASVRPAPADMSAAAPYGQFATAAALALAVGRSVTESAPGAACFTGAWTASVFGHAAPGGLGSWPGDADEALDMLRARQAVGFDELAGYADGFAHGWSACTDQ
jgi:hypothetical protein